jgi:hypothetical protein
MRAMVEAGRLRLLNDFAKQPIMERYLELYATLIEQYSV